MDLNVCVLLYIFMMPVNINIQLTFLKAARKISTMDCIQKKVYANVLNVTKNSLADISSINPKICVFRSDKELNAPWVILSH